MAATTTTSAIQKRGLGIPIIFLEPAGCCFVELSETFDAIENLYHKKNIFTVFSIVNHC
jgi:hypothetical protein